MRALISVPMWMVLVTATALTMGACGSGSGEKACDPAPQCPVASATASIVVTAAPAMAVNGVQATLTGPATGTMSCQPNGSATLCLWPAGVAASAGTYTLQVSAPGYQTTTTQVEVTVGPPSCGCTFASVEPSTVALDSDDASTD